MAPRDPGEEPPAGADAGFRDRETERELGARTRVRPSSGGPRRLVILTASGRRDVELPERGALLIGRGADADVLLDDPRLSRRHARLAIGVGVTLEDLGSANGTVLDGVRIAPGAAVDVRPGQVIEVGDVTLLVQRLRAVVPGDEESAGPPLGEAMRQVDRLVDRVAAGTINVLVLGETGVGKERTAARVHQRSPRRAGPFVTVNVAALSATLIESELFGHEKGAFTGAVQAKTGLLEAASGGTVFLDEVGELPLATQVKLLRVLEERVVLPVGSVTPRSIDVRVVAATHRDLEAEVAAGRFRSDLYYRLNGVTVLVPPLRERRDEIPALARHFIAEILRRDPGLGAVSLSAAALDWLVGQDWPGNVRELKNTIERAVLLAADGGEIGLDHLPSRAAPGPRTTRPADGAAGAGGFFDEVARFERERILEALERTAGNQTQAAKLLGIARRTLIKRLDEFGVKRPRKGPPGSD